MLCCRASVSCLGGEDRRVPDAAPVPPPVASGAAAEEGTISSVSDGGNGVLDAAAVTSSAGAIDGDGSSGAAAEDDEEEQEEPFFRKDANDVLLMDGPRLLRAYIGPLAVFWGPTPDSRFTLLGCHCRRRHGAAGEYCDVVHDENGL